jgi:(S)-ureidoglycine aminohydrolase
MKTNPLFGHTRDVVKERYALRTPSGFVPSCLPGWRDCKAIVQISPAMGSRFCQFEITLLKNGEGRGHTSFHEMAVYVIEGQCAANLAGVNYTLRAGGFSFVPPGTDFIFSATKEARLLIFEKVFEPLSGCQTPAVLVGDAAKVPGQPFLGNKDARLQVLLPDDARFDMAMNIFTYQPGATLPFVESHVMEHGLLMLAGQGVYRLDADWHPVQAGDVIWMAPFCPQWFVAMGTEPASYIYYKDVNRVP